MTPEFKIDHKPVTGPVFIGALLGKLLVFLMVTTFVQAAANTVSPRFGFDPLSFKEVIAILFLLHTARWYVKGV